MKERQGALHLFPCKIQNISGRVKNKLVSLTAFGVWNLVNKDIGKAKRLSAEYPL